jgi:hypothetical protein
MNRLARAFTYENRVSVAFLGIVEATSPPPNERARAELAVFSRDTIPRMGLAVLVAEGGGFRAAFVRGVGITLTLLMPHRLPFKFVSTLEEAATHLAPYISATSGGAEGLTRAVNEVRQRIVDAVDIAAR